MVGIGLMASRYSLPLTLLQLRRLRFQPLLLPRHVDHEAHVARLADEVERVVDSRFQRYPAAIDLDHRHRDVDMATAR